MGLFAPWFLAALAGLAFWKRLPRGRLKIAQAWRPLSALTALAGAFAFALAIFSFADVTQARSETLLAPWSISTATLR